MSARRPSRAMLAVAAAMVVAGLGLWLAPQSVLAQCGSSQSSCLTCHAAVDPVFTQGEWHVIHARKDCCRNCHGGNDQTIDQDQAHLGLMLNPLDDVYLSCHQCHPDDYERRAARFAAALKVTLGSSAPITTAVAIQPTGSEQPNQAPAARLPDNVPNRAPWLWALVIVVAGLLVGLAVSWRKLSRS